MDLLIIISNPNSSDVVLPLATTCAEEKIQWSVFITNDGVKMLDDERIINAFSSASHAIVCQESWTQFMTDKSCVLELGSQTNNSALLAEAQRVLSL